MSNTVSRPDITTDHLIDERVRPAGVVDRPSVRISLQASDAVDHARVAVQDVAFAHWLSVLSSTMQYPRSLQRLLYVHVTKRLLDILVSAVLCLALLPLMLVIAASIRLGTRGPVFYRQARIGLAGQTFMVYKFKTMVDDRRARLEDIPFPDRRERHKSENDPRVTRIGKFLRRTSLDELPQLINVLRGEMSLVGPRPEMPAIVANYQEWQHARHLVRPGITGWWQINGRSDRPMHENTELDIEYVQHVSLWMDLIILVRTIKTVLAGRGAF